jgi:hypothetical protein
MRRHRTLIVGAIAVLGFAATANWPVAALADSETHKDGAIPDFSGLWSHPYFPGFEPPLSGPGPILNKSRRRQLFDADGHLLPAKNAPLVGNPSQLVGDYTNPILKPWAAQIVKQNGELELNGVGAVTAFNQCWLPGVPEILGDIGMQMLQQSDKVVILYVGNEVRHVRMNQPHPEHVRSSWYGDSVGHYEGDTLVIDTVGIKADRPFAMVDQYGTPRTEALHVVERYRLLDYEAAKAEQERAGRENFRMPAVPAEGWVPDPSYMGKGLQLQFTVEDEGVFTTPWSATITYRRPSLAEWPEYICAENPQEYYRGRETRLPTADKPDF